jgi:DNA topoisomerase-1
MLRLYKLIYTRFLASQMPPAVFETLAYDIDAGGKTFKASGSRVLFKGHLAVYDSKTEDEDQKMLPKAEKGDVCKLVSIDPRQNFTQPPARYTEASLIKFLEERGIGRPSTYAPIISPNRTGDMWQRNQIVCSDGVGRDSQRADGE